MERTTPKDESSSLQEKLLVILTICLTPFLAFAALQAFTEATDQRVQRRAALVLTNEQAIDKLEASVQSTRSLVAAFREELQDGACDFVLERIAPELPALDAIVTLQEGRVRCAAGSSSIPFGRLNEALTIDEAGAAPAPVSSAVALEGEPRQHVALGYRLPDGTLHLGLLSAKRLTEVATFAGRQAFAGMNLAGADGVTFGAMPSVEMDQSWIDKTIEEQQSTLHKYDDDKNGLYDVVITPLSNVGLFAVSAHPALPFWNETRIRPLTTVGLPLMVFVSALLAVWISVDNVVLRWLRPLRRMAAAYSVGQYEYEPQTDFSRAPQEIGKLSATLHRMAGRIGERDAELRQAIEMKEAAVREIHHRVKNNLQIVNSFVSLQGRSLSTGEGRQALASVKLRIDALSIVHQTLYQHERLETVALRPFFDGLLSHLESALGVREAGVAMTWNILDIERPSDDAIPLALFILEAVTNAMKYAFNSQDNGTIAVSLVEKDDDHLELTIRDDGEGETTEPTTPSATGLGGRLMKAFAKQVKGSTQTSSDENGFIVTLTIPKS